MGILDPRMPDWMYWKQTAMVTGLLLLHPGRVTSQLSHFESPQFLAVLRAFLQVMDTQFLYQIPPKLPGNCAFSTPPGGWRRYNVLLGNDLGFPKFGIRTVIYSPGVEQCRTPIVLVYCWSGAPCSPTWRT
jgi:hypothetical protein